MACYCIQMITNNIYLYTYLIQLLLCISMYFGFFLCLFFSNFAAFYLWNLFVRFMMIIFTIRNSFIKLFILNTNNNNQKINSLHLVLTFSMELKNNKKKPHIKNTNHLSLFVYLLSHWIVCTFLDTFGCGY